MYRRYRVPSVWRELNQIQRDMNRVFDGYSPIRTRTAPSYPALNIWSNEEGLVVNAEVPGIDVKDIDISVVGETLTLSGARKSEDLEEGFRYHRQERGSGKFNRSVELPFPVDIDKVEATFKNGVLHISLPRSEADKPKKIVVKSA
jgi:HSP20 family protein